MQAVTGVIPAPAPPAMFLLTLTAVVAGAVARDLGRLLDEVVLRPRAATRPRRGGSARPAWRCWMVAQRESLLAALAAVAGEPAAAAAGVPRRDAVLPRERRCRQPRRGGC